MVFRFFKQMTKALDTVHSNFMVHRDVNTRNYLVTHDLNIKLHNFPTVLDITEENNEELKKVIGTAFYCPPVSISQDYNLMLCRNLLKDRHIHTFPIFIH